MKKLLIFFSLFCVSILTCSLIYLACFADEELEQHTDLEPHFRVIPDSENSFSTITSLGQRIQTHSDFESILKSTPHDPRRITKQSIPIFKRLYKSHQTDFKKIHEAIQMPHVQPEVCLDISANQTEITYLSAYIRLLSIEALYFLELGHYEAANNSLKNIYLFSNKLLESDGGIATHLTALHCFSYAFEIDYAQLSSDSPYVLDHEISVAQVKQDLTRSFVKALKCKWKTFSNVDDTHFNSSIFPRGVRSPLMRTFFYQKNETLNSYAELVRLIIDFFEADFQDREKILQKIEQWDNQNTAITISPNLAGRAILQGEAGIGRYTSMYDDHHLKYSCLQVLNALKAFKIDNNELPDKLFQLVPSYLASVPLDPYSGEPLNYSKERKVLWSIGNDIQNTNGVSTSFDETIHRNSPQTLEFFDEPFITIPF